MTARGRMAAGPEAGALTGARTPSPSRLLARAAASAASLALALGALLAPAQAAPLSELKLFRVPTDDSQPRHITVGADGNLWFTEGNEIFTPDPDPEQGGTFHNNIGRITPGGEITEFRLDGCQCNFNDIVQGPDNVLYFTTNNPGLGRITTDGEFLPAVEPENRNANGNGVDARGGNVWYADFNNSSLWRYNANTGEFTQFPVPRAPSDVAADGGGTVWFTAPNSNQIGRLDSQAGSVTLTDVGVAARNLTIAPDGSIWFTARFTPQAVGRLDPATDRVSVFPLEDNPGPVDIAAADGSVWFTQETADNVARVTTDGVITEGKRVSRSDPFGIAIGPDGQTVWYTLSSANKIARLTPR